MRRNVNAKTNNDIKNNITQKNSLTCLHKYKNNQIIPKGLRLKSTYDFNTQVTKTLERASKALV